MEGLPNWIPVPGFVAKGHLTHYCNNLANIIAMRKPKGVAVRYNASFLPSTLIMQQVAYYVLHNLWDVWTNSSKNTTKYAEFE